MLGLAAAMSHPEVNADPPQSPLEKLSFVINHLDHVNKTTMILAFASLGVMIAIRSLKPRLAHRPGASLVKYIPEILLVVVVGTSELAHLAVDSQTDAKQPSQACSDWTSAALTSLGK